MESCQIISDIENLSAQISYVRSLAQEFKVSEKTFARWVRCLFYTECGTNSYG